MSLSPRSALRAVRYALPGLAGRVLPAPGPAAALRQGRRLAAKGFAVTVGYFQADTAGPDEIVAANVAAAALLAEGLANAYLSVKAPPLGFAPARITAVARAGLPILLDAHALRDAPATHGLLSDLLPRLPGSGIALPARWRRSRDDAARLRDGSARLRLVKGEWPDPDRPEAASDDDYLALVEALAGRSAPVAIATHDPALAERALIALREAGTPCELEQLRGLPRRRTTALAARLGVPVRIYLPFGPGWWPYALNQALARPYLPGWFLRDAMDGHRP